MDQLEPPTTATLPESPRAVRLLDELHRLNDQLLQLDPRPSAATNAVFGRLVELCVSTEDRTADEVLAHPGAPDLLRSLRLLSGHGEVELERHWASALADADDAWATLEDFPYLNNYRELVRVELAAATAAGVGDPRTVAFLGAGPLPLTGLVLAHEHGARVINIDRDERACALATEVTEALSLSDRVTTVRADASEATHLPEVSTADVVVLAALVGEDESRKRPVLEALARSLNPRTTLLIRTARRMRTALYPAISPDDLRGLRPLLELHPYNEVVNSVLVARRG